MRTLVSIAPACGDLPDGRSSQLGGGVTIRFSAEGPFATVHVYDLGRPRLTQGAEGHEVRAQALQAEREWMESHLYLGTAKGHFVKIRVSYPDDQARQVSEAAAVRFAEAVCQLSGR